MRMTNSSGFLRGAIFSSLILRRVCRLAQGDVSGDRDFGTVLFGRSKGILGLSVF